jgi:hypothetical protein
MQAHVIGCASRQHAKDEKTQARRTGRDKKNAVRVQGGSKSLRQGFSTAVRIRIACIAVCAARGQTDALHGQAQAMVCATCVAAHPDGETETESVVREDRAMMRGSRRGGRPALRGRVRSVRSVGVATRMRRLRRMQTKMVDMRTAACEHAGNARIFAGQAGPKKQKFPQKFPA